MYKTLIIVLIALPFVGMAQKETYELFDTKCKERCDTSIEKIDGYTIEFVYNPNIWMDDLVLRMRCDTAGNNCVELENPKHYYATVKVYKNKKQVGDVMYGYYIKGETCWDADPEAYLRQALKTQNP